VSLPVTIAGYYKENESQPANRAVLEKMEPAEVWHRHRYSRNDNRSIHGAPGIGLAQLLLLLLHRPSMNR
jgi:hypothetical protein